MPLGQFEAQDVLVLRKGGDRLARHDDASDGDRQREHAASARRKDGAFARLLRDDVAIAAHRRKVAFGDVEIGLRLVELGLGADAALRQLGDAIVIGLRLIALGLLRGDARVERLHLKGELLVGHQGDLRAGGDRVALLDRQRSDRAADAGARDKLVHGFDGRDNRLAVGRRRSNERRSPLRRQRRQLQIPLETGIK